MLLFTTHLAGLISEMWGKMARVRHVKPRVSWGSSPELNLTGYMEGAVGYIRHHAIIVTTWPSTKAAMLVREFRKFGLPVTEPVKSVRNSVWTFLIGPDGSNEFWDTSERYDMLRGRGGQGLGPSGREVGGGPVPRRRGGPLGSSAIPGAPATPLHGSPGTFSPSPCLPPTRPTAWRRGTASDGK